MARRTRAAALPHPSCTLRRWMRRRGCPRGSPCTAACCCPPASLTCRGPGGPFRDRGRPWCHRGLRWTCRTRCNDSDIIRALHIPRRTGFRPCIAPGRGVRCPLLGGRAGGMLIGACDPILRRISLSLSPPEPALPRRRAAGPRPAPQRPTVAATRRFQPDGRPGHRRDQAAAAQHPARGLRVLRRGSAAAGPTAPAAAWPASEAPAAAGAGQVLRARAQHQPAVGYGTFRLNFHRFDRFELDLRGHTRARGATLSCLRLKLADIVLI